MGNRKIIPIGTRFGRLVVCSFSRYKLIANRMRSLVWCRCDCGKYKEMLVSNLKNTKSCGCARVRPRKDRSDVYYVWQNMIRRCGNTNHKIYPDYGGRGIVVCERWRDFKNFCDDMGKRPSKQHSLDRINNDGNYCKENCRWATMKTQGNNRRSNVVIEYMGESKTIAEWSDTKGLPYMAIFHRVKRGWPVERLFDPLKTKGLTDGKRAS